jgi:hypothetical protein
MNGSTTKVFASWKPIMARGTYNLMLKRLSPCLLQARVHSFEERPTSAHRRYELRRQRLIRQSFGLNRRCPELGVQSAIS